MNPTTRWLRPFATILLAGALSGAAAGCGHQLVQEMQQVTGRPSVSDVPDFVVGTDQGPQRSAPWTWCYGNGCADGAPPDRPLDVGSGDSFDFTWPDPGWDFQATFTQPGGACPRSITVPVEALGDGGYRVTAAGPAGRWRVDLFGRGQSGDAVTSVTWTTTTTGPVQPPTGSVAVLAEHDGELDSYGVELGVDHLAEQPRRTSATVQVTSGSGDSVTLRPRAGRDCTSQGSVFFLAPAAAGRRALTLGEGPFTYRVVLTLDGREYVGTARWPDDEIEDAEPHALLTWSPALPAYRP